MVVSYERLVVLYSMFDRLFARYHKIQSYDEEQTATGHENLRLLRSWVGCSYYWLTKPRKIVIWQCLNKTTTSLVASKAYQSTTNTKLSILAHLPSNSHDRNYLVMLVFLNCSNESLTPAKRRTRMWMRTSFKQNHFHGFINILVSCWGSASDINNNPSEWDIAVLARSIAQFQPFVFGSKSNIWLVLAYDISTFCQRM